MLFIKNYLGAYDKMGKQFKTYKQLIEEKERLQKLLQEQKQLIRTDINEIKVQIKPLSEIRSHVTQFTMQNAASLLLSLNSDVIVKKIIKVVATRAGWVGKVLVPYFLKNLPSSGFFSKQKKKIISSLNWIKKEFKKSKQDDSQTGE